MFRFEHIQAHLPQMKFDMDLYRFQSIPMYHVNREEKNQLSHFKKHEILYKKQLADATRVQHSGTFVTF